jgi:aryl-alcohol dehydrogenase-like predicted oxidoreductase
MKLALGTVQFGLPYGVSNANGQTSPGEALRILQRAAAIGVDTLDTARAYGDAERVLGELLPQVEGDFRLVSKVEPLNGDAGRVRASVLESCRLLGRERLDALMFHRSSDLLGPAGQACWAEVEHLQAEGRVGKAGVSVYNRAELEAVTAAFPIRIVQFPASVLDQRLLGDGLPDRLRADGVEVHVRSAFLQGLLLMAPDTLPPYFGSGVREHLRYWRELCDTQAVSPLAACLAFLQRQTAIDRIVVGVNTAAQLDEIVAAAATVVPEFPWDELGLNDPAVLDPSQWQVK